MAEDKLYLAYGSNINLDQMDYRCPDASVVGPVVLENYELLFRRGGFATIAPCEAERSTACCGASRRTVSDPWIATRDTPASIKKSR